MELHIVKDIQEITTERLIAINRLFQQFTPGISSVTKEGLGKLLEQGHVFLEAREGTQLVGLATLIIYFRATGTVGIIEQVMVDEGFRRRGIAKAMMDTLCTEARTRGLKRLDFTSHKDRAGAHAFYRSLGFESREGETIPFRYML